MRVAGVNAGTVTDLDVNAAQAGGRHDRGQRARSRRSASRATCSSQPQSLIAEYFLDCQPGTEGPTLPDDGADPGPQPKYGDQTARTVQNDLVQNTLREPFKERLALIINEFGTALAGNAENLNAAIRRGAPALQTCGRRWRSSPSQNTTIRDLNANSDQIISRSPTAARTSSGSSRQREPRLDRLGGAPRRPRRRTSACCPVSSPSSGRPSRELGDLADAADAAAQRPRTRLRAAQRFDADAAALQRRLDAGGRDPRQTPP